jgi:hypothetical protein
MMKRLTETHENEKKAIVDKKTIIDQTGQEIQKQLAEAQKKLEFHENDKKQL